MIGRRLRARTLLAQKVEAMVDGMVMNIMTSLGMPASRKLSKPGSISLSEVMWWTALFPKCR